MTDHYFEHKIARIHYYKFGNGPKRMFCFHGYGMHGKQFTVLEQALGHRYTFYGFDLFFHKETTVANQSIEAIRKGITKYDLTELIHSFCAQEDIRHFSVIAYSMGTYYSATLAELMPKQLDEFIAIAPSCLKPGTLLSFLSDNRFGNRFFEKMMMSDKGLLRLLRVVKMVGVVDKKSYEILRQEIATPGLRFSFYACASYLRQLKMDENRLVEVLNNENIRSYFLFGKRDTSYPPSIGDRIFKRLKKSQRIILDEDHDLVNSHLAETLAKILV